MENNEQLRNEIINTFSDMELYALSQKITNFASAEHPSDDYVYLNNLLDRNIDNTNYQSMTLEDHDRISNSVMDAHDNKSLKYGLTGLGIGAGIGGLYGALKKKKGNSRLKEVLKYSLLGGGLGGLAGGLAGIYSYNEKDELDKRLNKEIAKRDQLARDRDLNNAEILKRVKNSYEFKLLPPEEQKKMIERMDSTPGNEFAKTKVLTEEEKKEEQHILKNVKDVKELEKQMNDLGRRREVVKQQLKDLEIELDNNVMPNILNPKYRELKYELEYLDERYDQAEKKYESRTRRG